VAQLPVVIGKRADDVSQPLGVRVQSALGAVDRDVACNELREVLEPVLVAARVVAAIERRLDD
jgi:ribosomal protein S3